MSRPRTYDYAEVADVARRALAAGQYPGPAVADHYGISREAAAGVIRQARRDGHTIPAFDPSTVTERRGRPAAEVAAVARQAIAAGQPLGQYVAAAFGLSNTAAHAAVKRARQAGAHVPRAVAPQGPRAARPFTPPRPTGRPHACDDCGHLAATGWELAAHTLETHGRTLTATERAPRAEEVAA